MRRIAYICMIGLALVGSAVPAGAHGFGGGGPVHGMHGGGFRGGGFGGHHFDRGHFRHHDHFRGGVVVGVAPFWGPGWGYPYPDQTMVVEQPQDYIYTDPAPAVSGNWYYCRDSGQYYPYVTECPGGWTTVAPPASP